MDASTIESIVSEVLKRIGTGGGSPVNGTSPAGPALHRAPRRPGVYPDAAAAASAARRGFEQLRAHGYEARAKVVTVIKELCAANAEPWGKIELEETGIGRLDHKIAKLDGIPGIPGVEWLHPYGMSGDRGIAMEEQSPFGVVLAISPVTHSIPTIACNIINMVAAGNAVTINAHPGGAACAAMAVAEFNLGIERETGISDLITIVEKPSLESFDAFCKSPEVDLICVTGGPGVVKAAMQSGKRAICAGPGNPPVVVDETADLRKAANDIILGAAFDNNLLCIGEKQIFVLDAVYNAFLREFEAAGAARLNANQFATLTANAFTNKPDAGGCSHPVLNRELVGMDATGLARIAGATVPAGTELLFAESDADHPFVVEEQMMPCVPVVRVRDFAEAVHLAVASEHGYKHSGMIHTMHVGHMTEMGRALDSTLFVKNGPCIAGLGMGGTGYASFSIATTTGEGITTPATFTRARRCVLVDNLNIV